MNSKRKGKTAELEVVHLFRDAGFYAERTQQRKASPDAPDVILPAFPELWVEVKRRERGNVRVWMKEALEAAGKNRVVVLHRPNNEDWLATVTLDVFMQFLAYWRLFEDRE